MIDQPLISVSIPVYNEEKRIARAINSMCQQTHQNLEIIVVDDHSTDRTRAIVEALMQEDSRIQYHLLPDSAPTRTNWRGYDINAGYAARNYGFSLARGEWITTQDADDASLLNRIEVQLALAQQYKATLVTIQWQQLTDQTLDKKLDIDRIIDEKGEAEIVITPETLIQRATDQRGLLMKEPFHQFIPFPFKWFPYTRKLFYRREEPYPGADNSMLFNRLVIDSGIWFRPRNKRTWGTPSGRGTGRDFAYRVAATFKNSYSFKLPLYLWDVKSQNPEYADYTNYLV